MKNTRCYPLIALLMVVSAGAVPPHRVEGQPEAPPHEEPGAPSTAGRAAERKRQDRRNFQSQELMLAKEGGWIIQPGETPRILWRDLETVRRLGCGEPLRVRWFDASLQESPAPKAPGRWLAWIEGTAPNGTPLRRALTFYAMPREVPGSFVPDLTVAFPRFPGPRAPAVVIEHESELLRLASDMVVPAIMNSERGAIAIAGLVEARALGRPARFVESTAVMNDDCHLALKLKMLGLEGKVRRLSPPRRLQRPAIVLHNGTPAEAGVSADAKDRIDTLCRAWVDDTREPFVTLVARRGVIVTHEAFGCDTSGRALDRDYRCWVASITKTVTAILFSRFLDQGLLDLDQSLAEVFPDYPHNDPHVPTLRQCFTHTSGLTGHGEYGGMRNPHLENVVLNGIDVNEPATKYEYCGLGFELAAKAMEIVAGQSAVRLYDEHLFRPLGLGDVPIRSASADGEFTAMELGILAQWVANRGSYGCQEFVRPETFDRLLPEPVQAADRGSTEEEGIGMHWIWHLKEGAPPSSRRTDDLLFGPRTLGHGSFSGCIFLIDPDSQLVITQVRKQSGARSDQWSPRFFRTIAAVLCD